MSSDKDRQHVPKKSRRKSIVILSILLAITVCTSIFLFGKYRHEVNNNPKNQQQELTDQLSQLVVMPEEQPVISTVLDKSKLTNKNLTDSANDGDVLFIFPDSQRLILYRPSDKKVVDMLKIN